MNNISSTFYRLEKNIGDGYLSVVEFHTVVKNHNMYIAEHEEKEGHTMWIGKRKPTTKEFGNKQYKRLLTQGYKFAGKFQMNIFGKKEVEA